MSGPDLQNRDPNGLHETSGDNPGLKSEFSDILGEPEHMHSIDCAWKTAYTCYTCGLAWAYKIVSLLCGVPMSLCWGCFYGCIGFKIIWVIVPAFRCYNMASYWLKQIISSCLQSFLGPCFETCGLCLSKIVITKK